MSKQVTVLEYIIPSSSREEILFTPQMRIAIGGVSVELSRMIFTGARKHKFLRVTKTNNTLSFRVTSRPPVKKKVCTMCGKGDCGCKTLFDKAI